MRRRVVHVRVARMSPVSLWHNGGFLFFQAEAGIRDIGVTGVQTCALPICARSGGESVFRGGWYARRRSGHLSRAKSGRWTGTRTDRHPRPVPQPSEFLLPRLLLLSRSEERRVGKEGRSRWSPDH